MKKILHSTSFWIVAFSLVLAASIIAVILLNNQRIDLTRELYSAEWENQGLLSSIYQRTGLIKISYSPGDLLWDGDNLWITGVENELLQKVDPYEGSIIDEVAVSGGYPGALAWDGEYIWVASFRAGTLQKVDPLEMAVLETVKVCKNPSEMSLVSDDSRLWVICRSDRELHSFDTNQMQSTLDVSLDDYPSSPLIIDGDLWLIGQDAFEDTTGAVLRVDLNTGELLSRFPFDFVPRAMAWDGTDLWLTLQDELIRIGMDDGRVLLRASFNGDLGDIIWDGRRLWVADMRAFKVMQVDPSTLQPLMSYPLDGRLKAMLWDGANLWTTCQYSEFIVRITPDRIITSGVPVDLSWDGESLWVVNGAYDDRGGIQRVDTKIGSVMEEIQIKDDPVGIDWDGDYFYISDEAGDVVQQVDPLQKQVVREIEVGDNPDDVFWDGFDLWVVNRWGESVSRIDVDSGEVMDRIEVGKLPGSLAWDGRYLYVAVSQAMQVVKIDSQNGQIVDTFQLDGELDRIIWVGDGLWVSYGYSTWLQKIDSQTGAVLLELDTAGGADDFAWDGNHLWAMSESAQRVLKLDPQTGMILYSIMVQDPVALLWTGEELWAATRESVQRIDTDLLY